MGKEDRRESFLVNLGRATRRGVRQCKKCGTLNGTRGYSCKNKSCDVVFKEAGEKRKLSTEACKISSGSHMQIYSVRVRDKGPDYRGFVLLDCHLNNDLTFGSPCDTQSSDPLSSTSFSNTATTNSIINEMDSSSSRVSLQYVGNNHFDSNIGGGSSNGASNLEGAGSGSNMDDIGGDNGNSHQLAGMEDLTEASMLLETTQQGLLGGDSGAGGRVTDVRAVPNVGGDAAAAGTPVVAQPTARCFVDSCHKLLRNTVPKGTCSHIKAASQCFKNSESVLLKSSVLNAMPLHPELKTEIWNLATSTQGPLVQRVSKNIMVVKCTTDPLHPLGFLHFSFQASRSCRDTNDCGKYFCSCRAFKSSWNMLKDVVSMRGNRQLVPLRSCIHLYACLLALASHATLSQEFAQYIALITGEDGKPRAGLGQSADSSNLVCSMEEETRNTVKIQLTEGEEEEEDDTTAYIRVTDTGDEDLGRERSFLILNDGSDPNCQVEVEVLQDDTTDHLLQALDSHHHHHSNGGGESITTSHHHNIGRSIGSHHHTGGRSRGKTLVTQDELDSKLEIQVHTNEDGGVELCTSDGGSISVHPCVTASVHHQQLTTITNNQQHFASSIDPDQQHLTSISNNQQQHMDTITCDQQLGNITTNSGPHHHQQQQQQQHMSTISSKEQQHNLTTNTSVGGTATVSILNTGLSSSSNSTTITSSTSNCHLINSISSNGGSNSVTSVLTKQEDPAVAQASSALLTLHNKSNSNNTQPEKKRHHFSRLLRKAREPVVEENTSLSFVGWLAGATERINRTMQYTHTGKPDPLVFNIPTSFLECLVERIQHHSRKKIPAIQTSVPNIDLSMPAKQTRHAWHLYNLAHAKTVFHTPYVTLQTTRSFLVNRNGTYQSYQPPVDAMTSSSSRGSSSQPLIRPQEYRTIMRVGPSAYHPVSKPTPFIIEWIPDVFPMSKMGELRIRFEYEHIHNGHLVKNVTYKDVMSTSSPSIAISSNASASILQNPIIYSNSCSTSNSNITATQSISASKSLHSTKQNPPLIAPKITVLSQMKETALDDVNAGTILDISIPHETFVDSDGYTTLLFSADTSPILN